MSEQDNERFKNIYKIEESGEEASFNRLPANYGGSFKILEEVPVYHENGQYHILFRGDYVDKKNIQRIKVTSVSNNAFSGCISLERVYMPSSVTYIGSRAFGGCSALEKIDIPESVTSIGDAAFEGCSALKQIDIPESVTSIGYWAFKGCSELKQIDIPSSVTHIGDAAFEGCSSLEEIHYYNKGKLKSLNWSVSSLEQQREFYSLFQQKTQILSNTDVSIFELDQDGHLQFIPVITEIPSDACSHNISVKTIDIPSSVTSIGDAAFYGCSALKQIDIPSSITSIGDRAFKNCSALEEINIHSPSSVTYIGNAAFSGCSAFEEIDIPSSVTSIGSSAFQGCSALEKIDIHSPSSVTYIGSRTFKGCSALERIDIPSSVTYIGSRTFKECSALERIDIPSSVTSIGDAAFYGCSALKQIDIPSSVASIGNLAFYGCSALKQIHLPASVTYIGSSAFSGCKQLEKLVILGHDAEIRFPILENARTGIKIRIDSRNYCIKDHIIYNNSCSGLLEFLNPNTNDDHCNTEGIVIGDKTKFIGDRAFHNLSGIKKIVIPDTVIQIGEKAFQQGDSVDEIFIRIDPAKAKIEKSAFDGIDADCKIYVPVGTSYAYSHHEAFTRFKKDNIIIEEPEIP